MYLFIGQAAHLQTPTFYSGSNGGISMIRRGEESLLKPKFKAKSATFKVKFLSDFPGDSLQCRQVFKLR